MPQPADTKGKKEKKKEKKEEEKKVEEKTESERERERELESQTLGCAAPPEQIIVKSRPLEKGCLEKQKNVPALKFL